MGNQGSGRTAREAGWHVSRYNISAPAPDSDKTIIANLFKGVCSTYTPLECYLLSVLDELDEHHPIIERFAERGIIADFDERAAVEAMGRASCTLTRTIGLTICPTMGCNFDCPYCFESHRIGRMSPETQDAVIALAEKLIPVIRGDSMDITWFGGEPLLMPDIIASLSKRLRRLARENDLSYMARVVTNGYLLTPETEDILENAGVKYLQITVDGMGETHNRTRRLADGGPTFDRIVSNIRRLRYPFYVDIRHNVHEGNKEEVEKLSAFIRELDQESAASLHYYPYAVSGNQASDRRGSRLDLLCSSDASDIGIRHDANRFHKGRGQVCMAHTLYGVGIDDEGRLYKCWEDVDKPEHSFGHVKTWNPASPMETAENRDMLTAYLNTASPVPDPECRECVWLPACSGGCPSRRLFANRDCVAYKDQPEKYVLALYERILENAEKAEQ